MSRLLLISILTGASAQNYFGAHCTSRGTGYPECHVRPGRENMSAVGFFEDTMNETGWGTLSVSSDVADQRFAGFAAGFLEGYLTAERVVQMYTNYVAWYSDQTSSEDLRSFLRRNREWSLDKAKLHNDLYWGTVNFLFAQLDGLVAGMKKKGIKNFTIEDAMLLNAQGDISDIYKAVNPSARPNVSAMTAAEIDEYMMANDHCSAIVKLLPDASELFVGHNMWWGYYSMLPVFKHYSFPKVLDGAMASISLSSYPGILASNDDFYQSDRGLVILETTNNVYNSDLFDLVSSHSLLYWLRVMIANYIAHSGTEWMELFSKHNSGTYNNQWMVVDYNKFHPGLPPGHGTLNVGEQLPGYFHFQDQTEKLEFGYWPSYNKAFYADTSRMSGQDAVVKRLGPNYGHFLTTRAQVFRRDQATVKGLDDMKRLLRYNDYLHDPIAKGDPCALLACRGDLSSKPTANGATNAKLSSFADVKKGQMTVITGPTREDSLPVFQWSKAPAAVQQVSHVGQPDRMEFDWVVMGPFDGAVQQDIAIV